jgi:hypothetical protein
VLKARQVDVLREHEDEQHGDRTAHLPSRQPVMRGMAALLVVTGTHAVLVPAAHAPEHRDRDERHDGEPRQASLPVRQDDEGGQERTERGTRVAADLEQRLREPVLPARCQPRDARRLRVKHGRANPDQGGRREHHAVVACDRQQQQSRQREAHADGERLRRGAAIGVVADHRLQQRRRRLVDQRDQADVAEVELKRLLEDRVDRRQQRLDHVVEQMADAQRTEDGEGGLPRGQAFG